MDVKSCVHVNVELEGDVTILVAPMWTHKIGEKVQVKVRKAL